MKFLSKIFGYWRLALRYRQRKKMVHKVSEKKKGVTDRGETILFWVPGGYPGLLNVESIIGTALSLRGFNVHFIICDGRYIACARRHDTPDVPMARWNERCRSCSKDNSRILRMLELEYSFVGDYVSKSVEEELRLQSKKITLGNYHNIAWGGIELGKNLSSAMIRQARATSFPDKEDILREFAFTTLMVAAASMNAIKKFRPTKVYMSHGVYADWGPALVVSLAAKIPVVSYVSCYLPEHFYFGSVHRVDQAFQSISDKTWQDYQERPLSSIQEKRLNDFLDNRYKRNISHDMQGLIKNFTDNTDYFYKKYGLDKDKPIWGIMTHINWDSVSDHFPMLYGNFDEWIYDTVAKISTITDCQWLIKIHPSEANDNPETGAQSLIENRFKALPSHVKLIKMDDDISPLDFYNLIDGAVTVYGTGGLEISLMGKPVILAGESHYAKKGFTYDANDLVHYAELLKNAATINPLDEERIRLARSYAYCYFVQKQIPLSPVFAEGWSINYEKLEDLIPGQNIFIDFICERIDDGEDFVMAEEIVARLYPVVRN